MSTIPDERVEAASRHTTPLQTLRIAHHPAMLGAMDEGSNLAAIVSARADEPLLYAERSEPVDDADSGWQFSSDASGGGEAAAAQVWTLGEVLAHEPSLRQFAALPYGTVLMRASLADDWQVQN